MKQLFLSTPQFSKHTMIIKQYKLITFYTLVLIISLSNSSFGKNIPEDAFCFGEKIKSIIKDKNLESLFNLVDGELITGPRKAFIKGKIFNEIKI